MPRRIALALALAFTTVVTVAIIGVGAQAGMFSSHNSAKAEEPLAEAAPAEAAASVTPVEEAPPAAAQDPIIVTEYVYIDEPGAPAEARASGTPRAKPSPAASPVQQAEATPDPAPTQRPAPTATSPAPMATSAPPPAQASQPKELEFAGTVTSIDGDEVTFSYSGKTVVVRVSDPGSLEVGDKAHVHAILTSSGYVAKEIEAGD